jgi:hypothetical protein
MTPSGIDPVTFQFVGQCLNLCAIVCPKQRGLPLNYYNTQQFMALSLACFNNTCTYEVLLHCYHPVITIIFHFSKKEKLDA